MREVFKAFILKDEYAVFILFCTFTEGDSISVTNISLSPNKLPSCDSRGKGNLEGPALEIYRSTRCYTTGSSEPCSQSEGQSNTTLGRRGILRVFAYAERERERKKNVTYCPTFHNQIMPRSLSRNT